MPFCVVSSAPSHDAELDATLRSYRVEIASDVLDDGGEMIDWLIEYTFDTLGAKHLVVRVKPDALRSEEMRAAA